MMRIRSKWTVSALLGLAITGSQAQSTEPTQAPTAKPLDKPVSQHDHSEASKAFLQGAKALEKPDLRAAVKDFERASHLDPSNRDYSTALTIAREHLLTQLVQDASKARILGHDDQARAMLAEAYLIDPHNLIVTQHMDDIARDAESHDAILMPAIEEAGPPARLSPASGTQSFHLRSPATEVVRQVLARFGLTPVLDTSIKSQIVRFDADDVTFDQAAQMLKLVTATFFVPLDEKRVLVAGDTKENRAKFQRQVMETVYLPGLTPTEMSDIGNIVRNVFEAQQAIVQADKHTLTIRAPQDRISVLNQTLVDLLDGRSQLLLNVRLLEIDTSHMTNLGVQLPQGTTVFNVPTEINQIIQANEAAAQQVVAAGLAPAGNEIAIVAVLIATGVVSGTVFNQPFALFGGGITQSGLTLNQGATLNIALNSADTRMLDEIQLRVQDQEDATLRVGTRYPIITSTYSNLTPSSVAIPGVSSAGISSVLQNLGISASSLVSSGNQIIPQVQYEDLGLTLAATPHIQQNQEVALKIDFKIQALAGQTLNGNPILTNREYTGNTTLRQGESALVVSHLTKQQNAAVTGIPGLSELPGFQSTTNKESDVSTTQLVILITPQIVRLSHTKPASNMVTLPVHP